VTWDVPTPTGYLRRSILRCCNLKPQNPLSTVSIPIGRTYSRVQPRCCMFKTVQPQMSSRSAWASGVSTEHLVYNCVHLGTGIKIDSGILQRGVGYRGMLPRCTRLPVYNCRQPQMTVYIWDQTGFSVYILDDRKASPFKPEHLRISRHIAVSRVPIVGTLYG